MADFIRSQLMDSHGMIGVFSLRTGGVSPPPFDSQNFGIELGDSDHNIAKNIQQLVKAAQLPSTPHQAIQAHEAGLLWCNGRGQMHQQQADILITDQPDTVLAIRAADCLPVLLAEPESGIAAAIHAGWRGTAAGIVKEAIRAMLKHGAKSKNLLAALGPCIGPCCFAIGSDTADALAKSAAGADVFITHASDMHADLAAINRLQLLEAGLGENHIELNRACTVCQTERFFSFRREGKGTGRQLAVVAVPSST